jgi:CYTH domain-containing protein/thymidylate kinase
VVPSPESERNYIEVVLTGGPGSGKTTALPQLIRHFSERGLRVLTSPEVATLFISGGISDIEALATEQPRAYDAIQAEILLTQRSLREHFRGLAAALAPQQVVIVYDRAECDTRAYMAEDAFFAVLHRHNLTLAEVRDSYDLVVHMVTAADGAAEYYTTANNPARRENDLEAAIAADRRTLRAWLGHPHLRICDNSGDFEQKMQRLEAHVAAALGRPEKIEIERRFLLAEPPDLAGGPLASAQKIEITQTYLRSEDPGVETRVRRWAQGAHVSYFWTEKRPRPNGAGRVEREELLRPSEYMHLLAQADPGRRVIEKQRYCFAWGGQHCELDRIELPDRPPLWILEIELSEQGERLELPPGLSIEREVTDEQSLSNSALARL